MKKTTLTEDAVRDFHTFFEEERFTAREIILHHHAAPHKNAEIETNSLDTILALIKWTFLYLPGAMALHFGALGTGFFFLYAGDFMEFLPGMLGISIIATFLIMFGIGKLGDLKYLRVVLAVFAVSMVATVLNGSFAALVSGKYFGWFLLASFIPSAFAGYLVKIKIDNESVE